MTSLVEASGIQNSGATQAAGCGDSCDREGRLEKQQLSLSVERSKICAECGQHFTENCILVKDQRTHTGRRDLQPVVRLVQGQRLYTVKKRYQCTECSRICPKG